MSSKLCEFFAFEKVRICKEVTSNTSSIKEKADIRGITEEKSSSAVHCPSPSFVLHKMIYLKDNKWWGEVKGKQQRGGEGVEGGEGGGEGGDDNPAPSAATPSCQLSELWLLLCTLCTLVWTLCTGSSGVLGNG